MVRRVKLNPVLRRPSSVVIFMTKPHYKITYNAISSRRCYGDDESGLWRAAGVDIFRALGFSGLGDSLPQCYFPQLPKAPLLFYSGVNQWIFFLCHSYRFVSFCK
jgi:hypothetical protein